MLKTTPKVGSSSVRVRASVASSPQKQHSPKTSGVKSGEEVRIAVLGASGYTGAEVATLFLLFRLTTSLIWSHFIEDFYPLWFDC
jgi:hypothetical protein